MRVPHPIPYQGSKRALAKIILSYFPHDVDCLFEPFAGSAAISLAAAFHNKAKKFHINDINVPLMDLWDKIINKPEVLAQKYGKIWQEQEGDERRYYNIVRDEFNKTHLPEHLLFLLVRCVKASIRYNFDGEFNQSPDNRRRGTHPITLRYNIIGASMLLRRKTVITAADCRNAIRHARPSDLIYMDPPYQGVCGDRDARYISKLSFDEFVDTLECLIRRRISFIVSYDGRTGNKTFGKTLPHYLGLTHIEVEVGRSSQSTLLGRADTTIESLYLSPALTPRLKHASVIEKRPVQRELSFA